MKKSRNKLIILLGAGSSLEQGFPRVRQLNCDVARWAKTRAQQLGNPNFYGQLWRRRRAYASSVSDPFDVASNVQAWRTEPNYERVLGDLHLLMNAALNKPFGDPMLELIVKNDSNFASLGTNKAVIQVGGQLENLLGKLTESFRGLSVCFEDGLDGPGEVNFALYQSVLSKLAAEFEVGIYNLNYDTVALKAFPKEAFVGFDRNNGNFLPTEVHQRSEWSFVYHLHGSVHHRIRDSGSGLDPRITWFNELESTGDSAEWDDVSNPNGRSDGKRVFLSSLVAGGMKLDQIQAEPFQTLYSCLSRHMHEAHAVLIGGYGFGDAHINSVLANALRSRATGGAGPRVLVLDHDKKRLRIATTASHWATTMAQTLGVPRTAFRDPPFRTQNQLSELPEAVTPGEFEQVPDLYPQVAVWNGGFNAAAMKLPQILKWFSGDRSAL